MKKSILLLCVFLLGFGSLAMAEVDDLAVGKAQVVTWTNVQTVFGNQGEVMNKDLRVTFPRSDVPASVVNGVTFDPNLGAKTTILFRGNEKNAIMVAELALLDAEVNPVVAELQARNIEVTAVHNHFFSTPIRFVHAEASGKAVPLAQSIQAVLALTATPMTVTPTPTPVVTPAEFVVVQTVLGRTGTVNGAVLDISVPRRETITTRAAKRYPLDAVQSHFDFQAASGQVAFVGEMVLLPREVNQVIRTLRDNGIPVKSLVNHFLFDNPRVIFLHFSGVDDPTKVANAIKAALAKTRSK